MAKAKCPAQCEAIVSSSSLFFVPPYTPKEMIQARFQMPSGQRSHSDPRTIRFLQWEDRKLFKCECLQISPLGYSMVNRQFYGKEISRQTGRVTPFSWFFSFDFLLEVKGEQGQLGKCPERKGRLATWPCHSWLGFPHWSVSGPGECGIHGGSFFLSQWGLPRPQGITIPKK